MFNWDTFGSVLASSLELLQAISRNVARASMLVLVLKPF